MKKNIFILFSILFSTILKCQWSTNPSVNNIVCNEINKQNIGGVISDSENNMIAVWSDNRNFTNSYDIYAQKIDTFGNNVWTNNGVLVCSAAKGQYDPIMSSDNAGGAIVTWLDKRSNVNNLQNKNGLYAQRLSKIGAVKWMANGIPIFEDSVFTCNSMFISSSINGAYLVFWTDSRSGHEQIYCQKIDTAGFIYWQTNGIHVLSSTNNQYLTNVTEANGEFVLSWVDDNYNIYSQKINSTGLNIWPSSILVGQNCMNNIVNVCSDKRGGIFLSYINTGGGVHCIQRVDANGLLPWGLNGRTIDTLKTVFIAPRLASDSINGVFVTWQNGITVSDQNIYAQKIDHIGNILWSINGLPICNDISNQHYPIINIKNNQCIITWHDYRWSTGPDIFSQKIDLNGNVKWTNNGIIITNANGSQEGPIPIFISNYSSVIFWSDFRNGTQSTDVYCQKVFWNGTLENISKHENLSQNIKIFPNPTNKEFEIVSTKDESIIITNEYGEFIENIDLNSFNNFKIKITNLKNGVYFISGKKLTGATKLIVID